MLAAASSTHAQPAHQPPAEVLDVLVTTSLWPQQYEPYLQQVRNNPDPYVKPIARLLSLPDKLEDYNFDWEGVRQEPRWDLNRLFAHRVIEQLGRERAEPILLEFFTKARNLYDQATPFYEEAYEKWRRLDERVRNQREHLIELNRVRSMRDGFRGLMSNAMQAATNLESDIFIEPAFELIEQAEGREAQSWASYIVERGRDHPELLERLEVIFYDLTTPESVRAGIAYELGPVRGFDPASMIRLMSSETARLHREGLWPPKQPFTPDPAKLKPYQPPAPPPQPDPAPTQPPGVG